MTGVAVKLTRVPLHILVAVEEIVTDGATLAVTLIVSLLLVAVEGLTQGALLVITQLTILPLLNAALVYVLLLPFCTLAPFNVKL